MTREESWGLVLARAGLAAILGVVWAALFWIRPRPGVPLWTESFLLLDLLFRALVTDHLWRWVCKGYVMVLLLVGVLAVTGRRPRALGLGRSPGPTWRLVGLCFAAALPFQIWLGLQPDVQAAYVRMLLPGGAKAVLANAFSVLTEHALIEGVILALALPRNELTHAAEGWVPPARVWPALAAAAAVFGVVHLGKAQGELLTAFPGGLGLAYLTWRARSVWPGVVLHLATGATVLAVIALAIFA